MISRVMAEFESPELAELAVKKVKESVGYVYSGSVQSHGTPSRNIHSMGYSVIPTSYNNSMNFMTAVMETPLTDDNTPEPVKRKASTACIICGSGAVENVSAILNAMGGLKVRSL